MPLTMRQRQAVITVAAGNHGDQTITGTKSGTVEFRAAPGTTPTLGSLQADGPTTCVSLVRLTAQGSTSGNRVRPRG